MKKCLYGISNKWKISTNYCFRPNFKILVPGRVRELTRSSRSKLEVVWHQFSTVQFSTHQFVYKNRSVQFGARGQVPPFSSFHEVFWPWLGLTWLAWFGSGSVQSFEPPIV